MPALIVWNNGENYDANATWCIAVEPSLLGAALKLIGEIDNYNGTIMAIADEARWTSSHHMKTLDDWMRVRAFSLCILQREMGHGNPMAALMTLPAELRKRLADALLDELGRGGYHESWKPVSEEIAAALRREEVK